MKTRYPHALALLERMVAARPTASAGPLPAGPFAVGPAVLRAPPPVARRAGGPPRRLEEALSGESAPVTEEMLGELVDMVFVSADEARGGHAEVHLVFKAEVLGGLHLRLVKMPDGMHATFVVEDAAARRAVVDHVDELVRHLQARGFTIAQHRVEIADAGAPGSPA